MIGRKKKRCIDCLFPKYIWAYGRCQTCDAKYRAEKDGNYCNLKHQAEKDGDDTLIGRDSKENHPEAEKLIEKAKQIKHFSDKRQVMELQLKRAKLEKYEGWDGCCEGCGINKNQDYIDLSHRLSRKDYPQLLADIGNLDWYCRERCHPNVEARNFGELLNGREVAKYILENANQNTTERAEALEFLEFLNKKAS